MPADAARRVARQGGIGPGEPLRVLLIGRDSTLGDEGAEVAGDARARHLRYAQALRARRAGSEIRFIYYRPARRGGRDEAPDAGLRLYPTLSRHRAAFVPDVARTLRRVLAGGWRPHLVSAQTPWEEGVAAWALARALGARFVPQLHFDLFSPAWLAEHPLNRWRRLVAGRVLRGGDAVRTVSEGQRARVARELGIPAGRVCTVPVGVRFTPAEGPPGRYRAALGAEPVEAPVVLFVGGFRAAKNLPLWIETARRVAAEVPDVRFVLAGDGPEHAHVRARAAVTGIAERVLFLGAVGHERLPEIYAAADVFLLSSDYEGFPRVVIEACLAGVPTVSTDSPGSCELLGEGRGVLAPRGDAAALAAGVTRLLRDEPARRAMGEAARAHVRATFGIEALVERLLGCWELAVA